MKLFLRLCVFAAMTASSARGQHPPSVRQFLDAHCIECHDADGKKGGLDLTALRFDLANSTNFSNWVLIHDRVDHGEMPPQKQPRPQKAELDPFLKSLSASLVATEQARTAKEGRSTRRRLNRYEYENALRDLLHAPWLPIRDALPEDGERYRFNKSGEALDVSHVQMARYLAAADGALRQVIATQAERPETKVARYMRAISGALRGR